MELDHDNPARCADASSAGPHEGKDLDAFDVPTLVGLLAGIDEGEPRVTTGKRILTAGIPAGESTRRAMRQAGGKRFVARANDGGGGLPDPWP